MPLEVPRSANSNVPARPLPDVDPQWLLMAAAHMQSIGKFDTDPIGEMIKGGHDQLGDKKLGPSNDLPNFKDRMAPSGSAYPPAKPSHLRTAG